MYFIIPFSIIEHSVFIVDKKDSEKPHAHCVTGANFTGSGPKFLKNGKGESTLCILSAYRVLRRDLSAHRSIVYALEKLETNHKSIDRGLVK